MYKVLLVDDEDIVRKGLKTQIPWEKYGFTVIGDCDSGRTAEVLIKKHRPDLLITDIKMPDLSGLELISRVQKDVAKMQTIILSAYDNFAFAQEAIRYGVSGYLLKPIDLDEFDELMKIVLDNLKKPDIQQEMQESFDVIEEIQRYIQMHFHEKITMERLSAQFYISPSHISVLFKNRLNMTVIDYLTQLRIEEAKKLLTFSNSRVSDIAVKVGYEDYTYFCRVFRKATGLTPLDYRIRNRG